MRIIGKGYHGNERQTHSPSSMAAVAREGADRYVGERKNQLRHGERVS